MVKVRYGEIGGKLGTWESLRRRLDSPHRIFGLYAINRPKRLMSVGVVNDVCGRGQIRFVIDDAGNSVIVKEIHG